MPLSVNVEASETFPADEAVTLPKLRKAAKPSVAISGSVSAVDIASGSISEAKLEDGSVSPSKMGNATIGGDGDTNKRGVLLVSGVNSATTTGQFEQLWAGEVNQFLIGSGTVSEGTWSGDNNLKSKALGSGSSLEVTSQNDTTFDLVVKDNAIVQDMMASSSIGKAQIRDNNITLSKFAAGAGIAADGGIAENDATFWGGVVSVNPAATVGGYHGKVEMLQPSRANHIIYAGGKGAKLEFGAHPSVPTAWATVRQVAGSMVTNNNDAIGSSNFNLIAAQGISSIEKTSLGTYKIKFSADYFSTGDEIRIRGYGFTDNDTYAMPVAGTLKTASPWGTENNTVSTTNNVQEAVVTFYGDVDVPATPVKLNAVMFNLEVFPYSTT